MPGESAKRREDGTKMRARAQRLGGQAGPLLLIVLLLVFRVTLGTRRAVSVEILSPADGAKVPAAQPDGLPLHVQVQGLQLPSEGYAQLLLDGQLVANMEEPELYLVMESTDALPLGEHIIAVRILDSAHEPLGVEKYSSFTLVDVRDARTSSSSTMDASRDRLGERGGAGVDRAEAGRTKGGIQGEGAGSASDRELRELETAVGDDVDDPCGLDASQTTAEGPGLESASAGIVSTFHITPRNRRGDIIDPERCPQPLPLIAIVTPSPLEHRMIRDATGVYICEWTAEYAGQVKVEIKVDAQPGTGGAGHEAAAPIPGSPWGVTVGPVYRVYTESLLAPDPWPYGGRHLHTSRERRHHVPQNADGTPLVEGGDAAGIADACRGPVGAGLLGRCAFVTMISTDSYLAGALTLFYSVRKTGSKEDFVAMVTSDGLASDTLASLSRAGMRVLTVGRMKKSHTRDMSEERWNDNYTKLRLWQLAYEKLIFLDSDMVVLQPIDHLFALKHTFAAVPDAFHPCYLNTGFMVLAPSNQTFAALTALIEEVRSEESEQTLVNHYWLDRYHVLHYTYNFAKHNVMSPTRFDIYVEDYLDTVKVVHYLGVKPWLCSRDLDCMRHVPYYGGATNKFLYDLWWTIFESMCDEGPVVCVS